MLRIAFKTIAWLGLVTALLLAGYLWKLDSTITETFEGRRWSVPAVVYAQPLEIYPGLALTQAEFVGELTRVGYEGANSVRHPGQFNVSPGLVQVHLRSVQFVESQRASVQVSVRFDAQGVSSIRNHANQSQAGTDEASLRLDPAVIGSFFPSHGEDRVILTPEQVPTLLRDALKAVEDRSFDTHHGFDLRGIARAFWVNLRQRKMSQGGSTLTQQLVKSYYLDNRRKLQRKLRELAMAIILELRFEKSDLLNAYINEIFIGQAGVRAIHGFGLGAQFYFNRPLAELQPAEIATLVTIIRGPTYYNPFRHPQRVLERRNRVLEILHEQQHITDAQLAVAMNTPLEVVRGARKGGTYYPAFMDLVRRDLATQYATQDLASQGLKVFTTLAPRLQDAVESGLSDQLARLDKNPKIQQQLESGLTEQPLQAASVVTDVQTGEVLALAGGRDAGSDGFNRALNASRPMGSLIKPVVYALALEDGAHLATHVQDQAVTVELPKQAVWAPQNFDKAEHGQVPLIRALADSLNLATVNLGLQLGIDRVAKRLTTLSGKPTSNQFPSLLLGAEPRTPIEVSELYASFASGGFATKPKAVIGVLNEQGEELSHHQFQLEQRLTPSIAAQLTRAMQAVMQQGTGKSSRHAGTGTAGKTGTSDDYRDSWFAGYDATHLTVVWIGRDDNTSATFTGAGGALKVWDQIMADIGTNPLPINTEAGDIASLAVSERHIDYGTGLLLEGQCPLQDSRADISVLLPMDAELLLHPACSDKAGFGKRLQRWFGARP